MSDKSELEGGKRLAEDEAAGGSDRETRKKTKVFKLKNQNTEFSNFSFRWITPTPSPASRTRALMTT